MDIRSVTKNVNDLKGSSFLSLDAVRIDRVHQGDREILGQLAGKNFRIGQLGDFNETMLTGVLAGVEVGMDLAGMKIQKGGVTAALTFTQPSPLSGTALLTVVLLSGSTCTGNGTMTATLAGDELRVAIPSFTSASGVCTVWASDSTLTLKRST